MGAWRVYNYVTPGEMYSDYYGGNSMRALTDIAFIFCPIFGYSTASIGALFNVLTDGLISTNLGMILLSTE